MRERPQVMAPEPKRSRIFSEVGSMQVEQTVEGSLPKTPKRLEILKWKGRFAASFKKYGYCSTGEFVKDIRGR